MNTVNNQAKKVFTSIIFSIFAITYIFGQTKSEIADSLRNQKEGNYSQDFVSTEQTSYSYSNSENKKVRKETKQTYQGYENSPFALDGQIEAVTLGAGAGISVGSKLIQKKKPRKTQTFDGDAFDKANVAKVDQFFMHPYSEIYDKAGTVGQILAMATPAIIFATEPASEWLTIGSMYAESVLLAYGFKELAKTFVFRARPYMYYEDYPQKYVDDGDWRNSFPSGHTTLAFNAAAFTSYVFCTYNPDSKLKIPVIAGSYALAFGTAALRLRSGNHFLSDVITGAAIGTATGLITPFFHTLIADKINTKNFTASISPLGIYCAYKIEPKDE